MRTLLVLIHSLLMGLLCLAPVYAQDQWEPIESAEGRVTYFVPDSVHVSYPFIQYLTITNNPNIKYKKGWDGKKLANYESIGHYHLMHCETGYEKKVATTYHSATDLQGTVLHSEVDLSPTLLPVQNLRVNFTPDYLTPLCREKMLEPATQTVALELPDDMTVDLKAMKPGDVKHVFWANTPVVIYRRTTAERWALNKSIDSTYAGVNLDKHVLSDGKEMQYVDQPELDKTRGRSKNAEYFVGLAYGSMGSAQFTARAESRSRQKPIGGKVLSSVIDMGREVDITGRTMVGGYSFDLGIPPHCFRDDTTLVLGLCGRKNSIEIAASPFAADKLPPDFALFLAIDSNDADGTLSALARGASPNSIAFGGISAMHHALKARATTAYQKSRRQGGNPDAALDPDFELPTKYAPADVLATLIEAGADLNAVDTQAYPLVQLALGNADYGMAEQLIAAGATVNPKDCGQRPCSYHLLCSGVGVKNPRLVKAARWMRDNGLDLESLSVNSNNRRPSTLRQCIQSLDPSENKALYAASGVVIPTTEGGKQGARVQYQRETTINLQDGALHFDAYKLLVDHLTDPERIIAQIRARYPDFDPLGQPDSFDLGISARANNNSRKPHESKTIMTIAVAIDAVAPADIGDNVLRLAREILQAQIDAYFDADPPLTLFPASSTALMEVRLDGQSVWVPRNLLTNANSFNVFNPQQSFALGRAKLESARIKVLFPEMQGYSKGTRQAFGKNDRVLSITLQNTNAKEGNPAKWSEALQSEADWQRTVRQYGLDHYIEQEEPENGMELFVDVSAANPVTIECNGDKNVPVPHCEARWAYDNVSEVRVRFRKPLLKQWGSVRRSVEQLVAGFR